MLVALVVAFPGAPHESAAAAALLLLVKVAVGAAIYAGGALLLWLACGRPDGPERRALELLMRLRRARPAVTG
jgi:hypothetical protein